MTVQIVEPSPLTLAEGPVAGDWWVVIRAVEGNPSVEYPAADSLFFGPFSSEAEADAHCQEDEASIDAFITIDARSEGWVCDDVFVSAVRPENGQHVAPYLVGTTQSWDKVACGLVTGGCVCTNQMSAAGC